MENKKLKKFLTSEEFYNLIDKIDELLKVDPFKDMEKDLDITEIVYKYFFEKLSGENLVNYLKEKLNWLSEEEFQSLLEFIVKNLSPKREELWEEEEEKEELPQEETLEERERRYFELMKTIIKKPEAFILKKEEKIKEPEIKIEIPEPTVSFQEEKQETITWQEEKKPEFNLPSETIIIKSKKEEKKEGEENNVIDLSQM